VIFDPGPYAAGIKRLNEIEREAIAARLAEAGLEACRLAAAVMAADREVRAVYLFGSVASGTPARTDFDIDLAIDGGDVFRAMEITGHSVFAVDVVDLHSVPEHVRKRILETGVRLDSSGNLNK
jgi:predicted nucleotidyltransferase